MSAEASRPRTWSKPDGDVDHQVDVGPIPATIFREVTCVAIFLRHPDRSHSASAHFRQPLSIVSRLAETRVKSWDLSAGQFSVRTVPAPAAWPILLRMTPPGEAGQARGRLPRPRRRTALPGVFPGDVHRARQATGLCGGAKRRSILGRTCTHFGAGIPSSAKPGPKQARSGP